MIFLRTALSLGIFGSASAFGPSEGNAARPAQTATRPTCESPLASRGGCGGGRRDFVLSAPAAILGAGILWPTAASADGSIAAESGPIVRSGSFQSKKYSYAFTPPPSCTAGNKPLRTHLDEVNYSSGTRGYTYGITVDPVRINSLEEFGTPQEVGKRVADAEGARDGVTDVKLLSAARLDGLLGGRYTYAVNYRSEGSRGVKLFYTRIYVGDGLLYVLTGQVKEETMRGDDDGRLKEEIDRALESFTVV